MQTVYVFDGENDDHNDKVDVGELCKVCVLDGSPNLRRMTNRLIKK
jgi:hypothetical protein